MGARKLKLSQCMIVKDEEDNIRQALSWGKSLMWEQIVVDTGSTDRTVELAESMGAKVFHFDWIDDFAAAKNFAIRQASGNWIAFLDADEYMEPEDVKKLPAMFKRAERLGCSFLCTLWLQLSDSRMVDQTARQYRFFRNTPKIRYVGAIHEQLAYEGRVIDGHVLDAMELSIYHTGYLTEVLGKKNKAERNLGILLKEIEKRPQDFDVMGYLGDSYKAQETAEGIREAECWYQKAIPLILQSNQQTERDIYTILMLMLLLYKRGAFEEMLELYRTFSPIYTQTYDLDYLAGRAYADQNDYEKSVFYLERAMEKMKQFGTKAFNPLMAGDLAETWKALAIGYYHTNRHEQCVSSCVGLLRGDKSMLDGLELLLWCFQKESPEAVVEFLKKIYDIGDIRDRILLLRGAVSARAAGEKVLQELRRYCTPEELAILDKESGV